MQAAVTNSEPDRAVDIENGARNRRVIKIPNGLPDRITYETKEESL